MTESRLEIVIQDVAGDSRTPTPDYLEACARKALDQVDGELIVRLVDPAESAALNERYRDRRGPTNVLAFGVGDGPSLEDEPKSLGDIVICSALAAREADEQGKSVEAHFAHLVIHGCLHLMGHDHAEDEAAERMEAREREILAGLGLPDPYEITA